MDQSKKISVISQNLLSDTSGNPLLDESSSEEYINRSFVSGRVRNPTHIDQKEERSKSRGH